MYLIDNIDKMVNSGQWQIPQEITITFSLLCLAVICFCVYKIATVVTSKWVKKLIYTTRNDWDDKFLEYGVLKHTTLLIPLILFYFCSTKLFAPDTAILATIISLLKVCITVTVTLIIFSILDAINSIYSSFDISTQTPIKSFIQVIKVAVFIVSAIFIISALIEQSPWALLKAMGALTAVSMLVFKDSILGFVASIQLAGQKMIRIGDWVEMPKYGADGDVIDITLNTIKIQNWDKTISNVPTYAFVSESFKNWRGMSESGGRRIKRSFYLDVNSFKFCDEQMLEDFKKIEFISEYIENRRSEIERHNSEKNVNTDCVVNGRRMTNIGTFRYYIKQYLKNYDKLNHDMTFLIRQLEPTEKGLPIQIYVFTATTEWVKYEEIQADIFDHILTVVPEFGLRLYQAPSGADFRLLIK